MAPVIKFFIQFQHLCKTCKRTVDVVSRNDKEGLTYSSHFSTAPATPGALKFCNNSFGEFIR